MGSLKNLSAQEAKGLMPPGMEYDPDSEVEDGVYMVEEQYEAEGLEPIAEQEDGYNSAGESSGLATKGSDPMHPPTGYRGGVDSVNGTFGTAGHGSVGGLGRLGMNSAAAHSTMIIRRIPGDRDDDSSGDEVTNGDNDDRLVEVLGAPPAYSGHPPASSSHVPSPTTNASSSASPNHVRRTSRAERIGSVRGGVVIREADLGNGIDTIRPVKRVDAAGSMRASREFVGVAGLSGSVNGTMGSSGSGGSGTKEGKKGSDSARAAKAGRAMVDEVIVPTIENVSDRPSLLSCSAVLPLSSFLLIFFNLLLRFPGSYEYSIYNFLPFFSPFFFQK